MSTEKTTKPSASAAESAASEAVTVPHIIEASSVSEEPVRARFPIVAVAASAGGLSAFRQFLAAMPANVNFAVILIPHLDPTHVSLLAPLLARQANRPVVEVRDGMAVEPNGVYMIPPNHSLLIRDGVLHLADPPESGRMETAIDTFLRSLAADQQEFAVGVVLSGSGTSGTLGLREIRLAGGLTVVQRPDTAEFAQMPNSAIATGLIDFILPPGEMPGAISSFSRLPWLNRLRIADVEDVEQSGTLNEILLLLRTQTHQDFQPYRRSMLVQRISRRMRLRSLETLADYHQLLITDSAEVNLLCRDLLIGVTSFFRDPEAFADLENLVIRSMVDRQRTAEIPERHRSISALPGEALSNDSGTLRIWVAGCATGEEAYSIAMLLFGRFAAEKRTPDFQIFATDLNAASLEAAREGLYTEAEVACLSTERLRQFFVRVDDHHYRVSKRLRESIVFAVHNLISDAPFSRLDLVSCRNLLIYLEPEVQRRVVSLFHFALRQDGYLMLGSSETIGRAADQFKTVSRKSKLFRRIGPRRTDLMDLPMLIGIQKARPLTRVPVAAKVAGGFADMLNGLLLKQFAPAAVLMTRRYEILSLHGPVVRFLEIPSGEPTRDLLAMARPGLAARIRTAVHAAVRLAKPASYDDVMIQREDLSVRCRITVTPLEESGEAEGLLLVTLEDLETSPQESSGGTPPNSKESALITQLQNELKATSEDLQRTIEELEESNGELRIANEEALSMIEELQSANEERESSREELQSLNEELCTVNSQLQEKIEEIDRTNADMTTLLVSAEIAVLLLDDQLCIQQFSEPAAGLFKLRPSDIGRPFRDLAQAFHDESLITDCRRILSGTAIIEREISTLDPKTTDDPVHELAADQHAIPRRRYLRRILPLQSGHASLRGVVVTLTDISSTAKLDEQTQMLGDLVRNSGEAILLVDSRGQIMTWNAGASLLYGYSESEALKRNLLELTPVEQQAQLREELQRLRRPGESETFETQRIIKEGDALKVLSTIVPVSEQRGHNAVFGLMERVSEGASPVRSAMADSTFRSDDQFKVAEELQAILDATADAVITIDQQGIVVRCNRATRRLFGYSPEELIGRPIGLLMPSPEREQQDRYFQRFLKSGVPQVIGKGREIRCLRKDGSVFYGDLSVNPVDHLGLFTGLIRDISERRRLQNEILHAVSEEQRRIGQDLHDSAGQELTGLNYLIQGHVAFLEKVVAHEISAVDQGESFSRELDVIRKATGVIKTLQQKIRSVIRGLAPVDINGRGLMAALSDLATGITDVHQVKCTFLCDPPILMHDNQQAMHLYRIAQESVNNAIRHGKALEIQVELERQGDCTVLTVMDNGCGFDSSVSADSRGFGLHIMGYRASLIGAVLSVDRAENGGTVVSCRLPDSESILP